MSKMTVIPTKGSIEEKIRHERETRRVVREQEDTLYGKGVFNRSKDRAARGDYGFCKEGDKYLDAMRRYPRERDKISKEYHAWQASQRKYGG